MNIIEINDFSERKNILIEIKNKLLKQMAIIDYELNNSPVSELIKIQLQFSEWLEKTKGKDRLTQESANFINELDKRQTKARERKEKYDINYLYERKYKIQKELEQVEIDLYFEDKGRKY